MTGRCAPPASRWRLLPVWSGLSWRRSGLRVCCSTAPIRRRPCSPLSGSCWSVICVPRRRTSVGSARTSSGSRANSRPRRRSRWVGLLPRRFPAFPDRPEIDLYAHIEPARMVGGDLYDYLLVDQDRRLFFVIADVSGKGAPAALLMAATKEVVREAVLKFGTALDRVFAEANRKTASANDDLESEGGVFVTAFAGILDLASGEVTYASAGHDSPFVLGADKSLRQLETAGGPPLGVVGDFAFPVDRGWIEPGEVLLLYTDGVTEAENAGRALYSRQRLAAALAKAPTVNAQSLVRAVIDDLRRFVGGAEQADDLTLLALRRAAGALHLD